MMAGHIANQEGGYHLLPTEGEGGDFQKNRVVFASVFSRACMHSIYLRAPFGRRNAHLLKMSCAGVLLILTKNPSRDDLVVRQVLRIEAKR